MRFFACITLCIFVASALWMVTEATPEKYFERAPRKVGRDFAGSADPLILSKYLHDPQTAQKLSQVQGIGNFTSYAGYFTVQENYGSNMFFWFFPAQNGNPNAPLILFLQGGPGAASMFGLFAEMYVESQKRWNFHFPNISASRISSIPSWIRFAY